MGKLDYEEGRYILNTKNCNLSKLGFRRSYMIGDEPIYTYRFPVHYYLGKTVLQCELILNKDTEEIRVDVYDMDHETFPMFYDVKPYCEKLIKEIDEKILKEFKKLGVEKIGI